MSEAKPPSVRPARLRLPRATLRLQLGPELDFKRVRELVPYFAELGFSHLYLSPFLKARVGSSHGYDIVDHNRFDPQIGDAQSYDRLVAALARRGMGVILDFVPNHMGVGGADNPWWLSVLEWGRASPYARYFDIDWRPRAPAQRARLLLPFLGDHYGVVLEQGELRLGFEADSGRLDIWYYEHRFPLTPPSYAFVLRQLKAKAPDAAGLDDLIRAFASLQRTAQEPTSQKALAEADGLRARLAEQLTDEASITAALEQTLEQINGRPGHPRSFRLLHALLEQQVYRLAFWRVASDEINYRRFFDINDLAAIRVEEEEVFQAIHGLVLSLIEQNKLHGLRIDHVDGLFDPAGYCRKLREVTSRAPGPSFYLIVEKILAGHERLRDDWPVEGTTGYEFMSLASGLFVDPQAERAMTTVYRRFTGRQESFEETALAAKRQILRQNLASELNVLVAELHRIARQDWASRDFTRNGIREALIEVIAYFPVYRTYITAQGADEEDRRILDWAIGRARQASEIADETVFDFLHAVLSGDAAKASGSYRRTDVYRIAMKFQQLTSPAMAKAVEDTAFYRYHRLVCLNDVGSEPERFGFSPAAFHFLNQERLRHHPLNLLSTATHDHKRGEDARARLAVLSELPHEWSRHLARWSRINRTKRVEIDGTPAPGRNVEYLLYQTLLAAWPPSLDLENPPEQDLAAFAGRIADYMVKAVREAKERSSWSRPNSAYEQAVVAFVQRLLDPQRNIAFQRDFAGLLRQLLVPGAVNGLVQVVLKMTAPGVPDSYQGCELWDHSLVDPDNRRAVDYELGKRYLTDWSRRKPQIEELLVNWQDGRIKLYLLRRLLALRQRYPALFLYGDYTPLNTEGPSGDRVVAFLRSHRGTQLVVAVPRLASGLLVPDALRFREGAWTGTSVSMTFQVETKASSWLTGASLELAKDSPIPAQELFAGAPIGLWLFGPTKES